MHFKSMSKSLKGGVKEILGTAFSVGCRVDGRSPKDISDDIESGEIESNSHLWEYANDSSGRINVWGLVGCYSELSKRDSIINLMALFIHHSVLLNLSEHAVEYVCHYLDATIPCYNFKCQRGSPKCVNTSTPIPLLTVFISSLDIFMSPIARACVFPSAITATTVPSGMPPSIRAPFDVRPGHLTISLSLGELYIMFAPDSTNLIAPRSTCTFVNASGSAISLFSESYTHLCTSRKDGT